MMTSADGIPSIEAVGMTEHKRMLAHDNTEAVLESAYEMEIAKVDSRDDAEMTPHWLDR